MADGQIASSTRDINGWAISEDGKSAEWNGNKVEIVPEDMPARVGGRVLPKETPNLALKYGKLYKPAYVEYVLTVNGVAVERGTTSHVARTAWSLLNDELTCDLIKGARPQRKGGDGSPKSLAALMVAMAVSASPRWLSE